MSPDILVCRRSARLVIVFRWTVEADTIMRSLRISCELQNF
jgi:hypothetical protein